MGDDARRVAGSATGQRRLVAAAMATTLLLLAAFALLIHNNEASARRALDERFETRASLTASFTRDYVDDVARRERLQAEDLLAGPEVDRAVFEQVTRSLGFEAAVVLDDRGRLLQVYPSNPELIGKDLTVMYPHLRSAVGGKVAVSEMVPSAAEGRPVTAIATPYRSLAGQRVFSGAFTPATTPLGAYYASAIPISGGNGYLVDRSDDELTGANLTGGLPRELRRLPVGITHLSTDEGPVIAVVAEVADTPWRVVFTSPSAQLHAPVANGRWAPRALLAGLALAGVLVCVLLARLGRARAEASETARTDALTGLPNRRAMDEMLARSLARAARHREPLAVLMVDLDHFKAVNDRHGHEAGDVVLQAAATALRRGVRDDDLAGRWGGEEFLVVLPTTEAVGAAAVAERLRTAIASVDITFARHSLVVTASIGVALLADEGDAETLLRAADTALYRAKAGGRNRVEVVVASTSTESVAAVGVR